MTNNWRDKSPNLKLKESEWWNNQVQVKNKVNNTEWHVTTKISQNILLEHFVICIMIYILIFFLKDSIQT